ncbi:MAG TPA: lipocalin family protein [Burkholderiaceae bacterium]
MRIRTILSSAIIAMLAACATVPDTAPPLTLATHVDLPRFMGDWYVIASIPTIFEDGAHNAKDTYALRPDGTIATTFTFNAGAPDGPVKHYESIGHVLDRSSNAVWGQRYIWPFQADYRISYVSPEYDVTVVTRAKRDHVWIMARAPSLPDAQLARLTAFVASQGYDVAKLRRVPQIGAQ